MLGVEPRQGLAAQQVAAVGIAQRQRLATPAVAGHEPALEVDAPNVVSRAALGKRSARRRTAPPQPTLDRQPFAIKQRADRAHRRPRRPRETSLQRLPHLHRSPGRMRQPHRQAALGDRLRDRLRMMQRRPRTVAQTFDTPVAVPRKPLVAGLPAYPEASAHHRKRLVPPLNRHHKAHPLVHGTGLHPAHRQGPPRRSVELLPMSPV
jgi:hypothetical protein